MQLLASARQVSSVAPPPEQNDPGVLPHPAGGALHTHALVLVEHVWRVPHATPASQTGQPFMVTQVRTELPLHILPPSVHGFAQPASTPASVVPPTPVVPAVP